MYATDKYFPPQPMKLSLLYTIIASLSQLILLELEYIFTNKDNEEKAVIPFLTP